jgi:sugar phosphate permease
MLFSATTLAGAFGGVLAFGIGMMNGLGGQEGWRWIFYIEGIITVVVGVCAFVLVKDFPSDRPKFLSEEECNQIISRLQNDAGPGAGEQFSWKQVRATFFDWKIYIFCLCYIGIDVSAYSIYFFTPTIVEGLGFSSYRAQLMSAPPYAFAFLTTMTTAYFSDKYARRAIFIIFWLIITIIGYIILIVVQNLNVKYFALFLTTGGTSPCVATCITFLSCNISPHTKRATALAFMLSIGNCGGAISGQIYRTQDAPRFILGHAINLAFSGLSLITVIILLISLRLENRRRDSLYGPVDTHSIQTTPGIENTDVCVLGSEEDRRKWGYENMIDKDIRNLGDKHAAWRYIL